MNKYKDVDIDIWQIDWEANKRKSLEEEKQLDEIKMKAERYDTLVTILGAIGLVLIVVAVALVERM